MNHTKRRMILAAVIITLIGFAAIILVPLPTEEEKQANIAAKQAWQDQQKQLAAEQEARRGRERIRLLKQRLQNEANDVVQSIVYAQDPRTTPPTCYAYYWGGHGHGGPALATVSCETIPPNLLVVANAK